MAQKNRFDRTLFFPDFSVKILDLMCTNVFMNFTLRLRSDSIIVNLGEIT